MKRLRDSGRFWLGLYFCVLLIFIASCSSTPKPTQENIIRKEFNFRLLFVDKIPNMPNARAKTYFQKGTCYVVLKNNDYLGCLLHELRHCLEDDWHGDEWNNEYCSN